MFDGFPLFIQKRGEDGHIVAVQLPQIFQQQVGEAGIASRRGGKMQAAVVIGSCYGKVSRVRVIRNVQQALTLR